MFGMFLPPHPTPSCTSQTSCTGNIPKITGNSVRVQQFVCGLRLDSPFSFKGGLWYVGYRYHLLSRSHPHDRTVVALSGIHLIQAGEGPPRKRELHPDRQMREDTVEHKAVCQNTLLFFYMPANARSSTPPVARFATDFPDALERVGMGAKALRRQEMPEDICLLIFRVLPHWHSGDLSEVSKRRNKKKEKPDVCVSETAVNSVLVAALTLREQRPITQTPRLALRQPPLTRSGSQSPSVRLVGFPNKGHFERFASKV